jgi:hypothetical protein
MKIMEQRNDCEISSEYECPQEMQLHNLLYRELPGNMYEACQESNDISRRCHFKHVSLKQSRFYNFQTSTAHS